MEEVDDRPKARPRRRRAQSHSKAPEAAFIVPQFDVTAPRSEPLIITRVIEHRPTTPFGYNASASYPSASPAVATTPTPSLMRPPPSVWTFSANSSIGVGGPSADRNTDNIDGCCTSRESPFGHQIVSSPPDRVDELVRERQARAEHTLAMRRRLALWEREKTPLACIVFHDRRGLPFVFDSSAVSSLPRDPQKQQSQHQARLQLGDEDIPEYALAKDGAELDMLHTPSDTKTKADMLPLGEDHRRDKNRPAAGKSTPDSNRPEVASKAKAKLKQTCQSHPPTLSSLSHVSINCAHLKHNDAPPNSSATDESGLLPMTPSTALRSHTFVAYVPLFMLSPEDKLALERLADDGCRPKRMLLRSSRGLVSSVTNSPLSRRAAVNETRGSLTLLSEKRRDTLASDATDQCADHWTWWDDLATRGRFAQCAFRIGTVGAVSANVYRCYYFVG